MSGPFGAAHATRIFEWRLETRRLFNLVVTLEEVIKASLFLILVIFKGETVIIEPEEHILFVESIDLVLLHLFFKIVVIIVHTDAQFSRL